jgi:cytochrome b subunit of formate dehydrogenase
MDYTKKERACHYHRCTATVPLFFSILLISSIHFWVNWLLEVVLSPLLKTLLQMVLGFWLFAIISPLSMLANSMYE